MVQVFLHSLDARWAQINPERLLASLHCRLCSGRQRNYKTNIWLVSSCRPLPRYVSCSCTLQSSLALVVSNAPLLLTFGPVVFSLERLQNKFTFFVEWNCDFLLEFHFRPDGVMYIHVCTLSISSLWNTSPPDKTEGSSKPQHRWCDTQRYDSWNVAGGGGLHTDQVTVWVMWPRGRCADKAYLLLYDFWRDCASISIVPCCEVPRKRFAIADAAAQFNTGHSLSAGQTMFRSVTNVHPPQRVNDNICHIAKFPLFICTFVIFCWKK